MEEYYACIIDLCPVSGEDLKKKSNNLQKAVFNTTKVVEPPIYEPKHSFYFLQERQCLLCVSFYILINFISFIHLFSLCHYTNYILVCCNDVTAYTRESIFLGTST